MKNGIKNFQGGHINGMTKSGSPDIKPKVVAVSHPGKSKMTKTSKGKMKSY